MSKNLFIKIDFSGGVPEDVTLNIKTLLVHFGDVKKLQIYQITPQKYSLSLQIESESSSADIKLALKKMEILFKELFVETC